MTESHVDCECEVCKEKSSGAKKILEKISSIIPNEIETTSSKMLSDLKNLETSFNEIGGISDIVAIAEDFFRSPENQTLEKISSKFDTSGLKIEISNIPPTLKVEKTFNFGVFSTDLAFSMSQKGFTWLPVLKQGIDSKEQALEKLKGVKSEQPVTFKTSLEKAKKIAIDSYGSQKSVQEIVASSNTIEDFLSLLGNEGIQLFEEVDIYEQMKAMVEEKNIVVPTYTDQEEDCGSPSLVIAPFSASETEALQKDCCSDEGAASDGSTGLGTGGGAGDGGAGDGGDGGGGAGDGTGEAVATDTNPSIAIGSTVTVSGTDLRGDQGLSDEDSAKATDDVNTFVTDMQNANQVINGCAQEKQNALNSYYLYYESSHLNEIARIYVESRMLMLDSLLGTFDTLIQRRYDLIQENIELRKQESALIVSAFESLRNTPGFYSGFTGSVGSTGAGAVSLTTEARDIIGPSTTTLSAFELSKVLSSSLYLDSANTTLTSISQNENEISILSNTIEDQKTNFSLPSFTESEILDLQTYGPTFSGLGGTNSVLVNKTAEFKSYFLSSTNVISNQVGFQDDLSLSLYVHPNIYEEARTLFFTYAPPIGETVNYVRSIGDGMPLQPIGATSQRKGLYATEIWDKYYSNNRVDLLFTYQEQGYTSPKPQFSASGQPLDPTTQVKIKSATGETIENVSSSALNLGINQEIATDFWKNLERKTKEKIITLFGVAKNSAEYNNYVSYIKAAAENEAKYAYSVNLIFQEFSFTSRAFDNYTNTYNFNQSFINSSVKVNLDNSSFARSFKNQYKLVYDSIVRFQTSLNDKMDQLLAFIEEKKRCIADQEALIEEKSLNLSIKTWGSQGGGGNGKVKDDCAAKLGSDPFGLGVSGGCPGITKNCYWQEYTKLMQIVSLMPIPDVERLSLRLFRYYPVAIQIPVPSPAPIVLPTLASGIPDPFISIPLPIIWKHIITLSTPVGLFVVWVTLCGPIPGAYVLYFDENAEPCFLVSPKGPIKIPAGSLGMTPEEEKSLLEYLAPLKDTFKVPLKPPFDLLLGASNLKLGDPDSSNSIIDKIQEKIKGAANSIKDINFQIGGIGATGEAFRKKVREALDKFPPDIETIEKALNSLDGAIDEAIDGIKISPIKIPKNPKKLMTPPIGPAEFMEDIDKLLDSGVSLEDLGLKVGIINLRKEVKKMIDRELSDPEVKQAFLEVNQEIRDFEAALVLDPITVDTDKVTERVKKIKKALKAPIQKIADKITPEMLGFVAVASIPLPLPVPCYDNISLPPVPPYILALMAAIKALPSLIDGIPDDALANALSKSIDLSVPLPTIEDAIFFAVGAFLQFVPDLSFPDLESVKAIKQIVKASIQNFFKIKVRLPKPGSIQITIPPDMIKAVMKNAIKIAFAAFVTLVTTKLIEASTTGDVLTVLAVIAIIKAVLGTDLASVTGNDIKSFIISSLESIDEALEDIQTLITPITQLANTEFKSIKEQLFPFPPKLPGTTYPSLEISTEAMINAFYPLLTALKNVPIPFPLVLLGCSVTPARLILTKIHPFNANEKLPPWEKLSLSNLPFVIWLDQLIATAQKQGGLGSNYLVPYWFPDAP